MELTAYGFALSICIIYPIRQFVKGFFNIPADAFRRFLLPKRGAKKHKSTSAFISIFRRLNLKCGDSLKKALSATAAAAGVLTLMSFALKGLGMLFRVYLSDRMGSAGLGLYQLVMSVYSAFAAFATAGFTTAVSRLAAERLGDPNQKRGESGALRVLYLSSFLAVCMGCCAGGVLYGGARFFAKSLILDFRASAALRILAISMPFMSLSSCLKGYFTAIGQIYKPTLASLFEQCAKIAIIVYTFETVCKNVKSPTALCTAVVAGLTAGEALSYAFLFVLFLFFSGRRGFEKLQESRLSALKGIAGVTAPIAASAYITNLLHGAESVLIPRQFAAFGGGREKALADFGIIRGMTIPMLFFPYAFLGALLSIQVPAVSRLNTVEDKSARNRLIGRIMGISAAFSVVTGVVFFVFAREISLAVYGTDECVFSTRVLALVTPFMYMETMSDGLLKSIGEQNRTLLYGVLNSAFRIAAMFVYIPHSGSRGYLWLLLASNTLSFALCFFRLKRVAELRLDARLHIACPLMFSALGALAASPLRHFALPAAVKALLCVAVCAGACLLFYMPVLRSRRE